MGNVLKPTVQLMLNYFLTTDSYRIRSLVLNRLVLGFSSEGVLLVTGQKSVSWHG